MNKMKKPKSIKPPMPIVTPTTNSNNSDNDTQFELELCWCVQQLENALNSGKLSQKVADDTVKNLKILKGNSAPLIKKRQVMKSAMGDYRAKMKDEEKKMGLASKQIKFTSAAQTNTKSSFVKKSAILTTGKDFKFNFNAANTAENQTQEVDVKEDHPKEATNSSTINTKNLELSSGNGFKFNFAIDEVNNEMKFDELSIK
ncbi:UPF0488 protein CG14286 [Calliphora vicina]|uniref:UPF0488 protein CG14286 n=1 Tax=Calliphora vicina TaxID=7373 RepID=UPI00325AF884